MAQFKVGDYVVMRDKKDGDSWSEGVVTKVSPLVVQFRKNGATGGYVWDEVRPQTAAPTDATIGQGENNELDYVAPKVQEKNDTPEWLAAGKETIFGQKINKLIDEYVERPCRCISCCCGCLIFWSLFALTPLCAFGHGCMTMTLEVEGAWSIMDATHTQRAATMRVATGKADPIVSVSEKPLTEYGGYEPYQFFYKSADEGEIFRPEQLQDICLWEKVLFTSAAYRKFCRRLGNGDCMPYSISPIRYFYQSPGSAGLLDLFNYSWDCARLDAGVVNTLRRNALDDAKQYRGDSNFAFFFDKDSPSQGVNKFTRSMAFIGYPVPEVMDMPADTSDEQSEREKKHKDIVKPEIEPIEEQYRSMPDEAMEYGPGGLATSGYQVDDDRFTTYRSLKVRFYAPPAEDFFMIQGDFFFAIFSIIFVWCYMYFHLNSSFLASMGMLQIMSSLPLAGIFYQGIFFVRYFDFLHILTIFLVLGVGADDIFVLSDTWKETRYRVSPTGPDGSYTQDDLKLRMKVAWWRTAKAIFNTSFTTSMAFLSASVSKVMPMRTNGWYAALAIIFNYVLTTTLTPATLMIHHYRLEGKRCCCPLWDENKGAPFGGTQPPKTLFYRMTERFAVPILQKQVGPVRIVPLTSAIFMFLVMLQGTIFTAQLERPNKEEVWFPENHMHNEIDTFIQETYLSSPIANLAEFFLYYGIEDFDTSDADTYDPWKDPGQPVWSNNFDLSKKEAQNAMLSTCNNLAQLKCTYKACGFASSYGNRFVYGPASGGKVICPLKYFKEWYEKNNPQSPTLPTGSNFIKSLKEFRSTEFPEELKELQMGSWEKDIGFVDGKLRYMIVSFRSTVSQSEPAGSGQEIQEWFEDWVAQERANSPASAAGPYEYAWIFLWYDINRELLLGLTGGCAIALPICFFVLLFATSNIILSLYAIICVAGVVLCVLGWCQSVMGYYLGIGESIAGVIVIGYSVDYVVHLAHMYQEANEYGNATRDSRAAFALLNMGGTVFGGAITTMGAGLIMLACFSTFFHKMAVLITMTIVYSFLFSFFLFVPLLFLIGPEGTFGDLHTICENLRKKLSSASTAAKDESTQ